MTVIHVLRLGRTLCGMSFYDPNGWPEGHVWVDRDHEGEATCSECRLGPSYGVLRKKAEVVRVPVVLEFGGLVRSLDI